MCTPNLLSKKAKETPGLTGYDQRFEADLELRESRLEMSNTALPATWIGVSDTEGKVFTASNGIEVASSSYVDLHLWADNLWAGSTKRWRGTLYLQGKNRDEPVRAGRDFSSPKAADAAFREAAQALREFADAVQAASNKRGIPIVVEKRETLNYLKIVVKYGTGA